MRNHQVMFGALEARQTSKHRTRYALCGLSKRGIVNYALPLMGGVGYSHVGDFSAHGQLVGILDFDPQRIEQFNQRTGIEVPGFGADAFEQMVERTRPEVVIVAGPDGTHAEHIVAGLEAGLDVITEKPMVIDAAQARRVIDAEKQSSGRVRVGFNYRYTQQHMAIKRMILEGRLGDVVNVELTWNIDTMHGSSYFYRWNRDRAMSGGMSITKACHHFDLVNWWLNDVPEEVFAYGKLSYYGDQSPHKPEGATTVAQQMARCPYQHRWNAPWTRPASDDHAPTNGEVWELPYPRQYGDVSSMYIYDPEIVIEDNYSVVAKYRGGPSLSYSTNFSAPWEGYQLGINGTHGRIEATHYTAPPRCPFPVPEREQVVYYPIFGQRQVHEVQPASGGHGGADPRLKWELFVNESEQSRRLNLQAGSHDGAYAVVMGEAVWRSIDQHEPINIDHLLSRGASTSAPASNSSFASPA